ncbi:hypothetical protein TNCT1_60600 [Streptomyces sp. 1-11]|nr:hypothetical protein TNCT1_60600 [Streptomyces sp. 1-11]
MFRTSGVPDLRSSGQPAPAGRECGRGLVTMVTSPLLVVLLCSKEPDETRRTGMQAKTTHQ